MLKKQRIDEYHRQNAKMGADSFALMPQNLFGCSVQLAQKFEILLKRHHWASEVRDSLLVLTKTTVATNISYKLQAGQKLDLQQKIRSFSNVNLEFLPCLFLKNSFCLAQFAVGYNLA